MPAGPVYSVKDMFEDPHFHARGLFEQVTINGKPLKIPALSPKLSSNPGRTHWPGREVGEDTDTILRDVLGLADSEVQRLRGAGVFGKESV